MDNSRLPLLPAPTPASVFVASCFAVVGLAILEKIWKVVTTEVLILSRVCAMQVPFGCLCVDLRVHGQKRGRRKVEATSTSRGPSPLY